MNNKFFPESLKSLPVWILWKLEPDKSGRLTKVPYSAKYDGRASSTNENTWDTYEHTVRKFESRFGEYDGIGIMLSTKFQIIFIDIDHCISYEDGEAKFSPVAEDILSRMGSQFVELSQSKTGVHILAVGEFEKNFKSSETGVEMYKEKRFVAMTGRALAGNEPHRDPEAVEYIYNKYKASQKSTQRGRKALPKREGCLCLDDKKIIDRASRNSKFRKLYVGDWSSAGFGSQSEGDLAMCCLLAFWTDCDPEAIDRIFRLTGLYREKWEREDYRSETISKAIGGCEETWSEYCQRMKREEIKSYEQAFFSRWICNS